jgi:hypothetical protein
VFGSLPAYPHPRQGGPDGLPACPLEPVTGPDASIPLLEIQKCPDARFFIGDDLRDAPRPTPQKTSAATVTLIVNVY